jgi:hypothetical protein
MCLAVIGLMSAACWGSTTIVGWDFEQGMGQWASPDPMTKISLAVGPNEANSGSSALYVKFPRVQKQDEIQQRQMPGAVMLQMPSPPAPAPTCLEFAVRAKLLTPLMVFLAPAGSPGYTRPVMVMPGAYRHVKLFLNEFLPDDKMPPPLRPLDGGEIQGIGFIDASFSLVALSAQTAPGGPMRLPMPRFGDNEIWLDDIKLTDEPPPADPLPIIDATADMAKFVAVMNADGQFDREPTGLAGKPCWVMKYRLGEKEVVVISGGVPIGALIGTAGLHVSLSATAPTTISLQVKKRNNAEYNTMLHLQPGQPLDRVVPWSEFKLGENQNDPDNKLDPGEINGVTMMDVSGALPNAQPQANELRIGVLEAVH